MDGTLGSIVGEVVVKTSEVFCGPLYSRIKNIFKYRSNLNVLKEKMKSLAAFRDDIKNETERSRREGKVLRTQVKEWLKEVEELLHEVDQIQAVRVSRCSLNIYRMSREVAKKLTETERVLKAGISHTGNVAIKCSVPTAVEYIPGPSIQDQTTASKNLAETMDLLSDPQVRRIGIWGMGGIGKTTLVRTLNNKLKSNSSMQPFGIVIWATVSKNFDMKKVQTQIAERLDLKLKKGDSTERLARRLYKRLEVEENFLLILDDVWEKIDLDRLGIPRLEVHTGSKIIFTTRSRDVCRYMRTDVDVKVDCLNEEEAWRLFSSNAGEVVMSERFRPLAEAVARECCGLPLAIIIVGAAMRGKTKVELWKHALNELQRSMPCTGGVEDEVFKPLKWSYDSLRCKNIKPCFLYCSLFPEDFSIAISELLQCWLAEGLLDEQENYEDSVNRGITLIENLKDACLLEDGAHKDTVKMHDVVRDVAIWISSSLSEDGCKFLVRSGMGLSMIKATELSDSLKRVSFMNNKIRMLPDCMINCSEASTLLLQGNFSVDRIPEKFLEGFEALKVLNIGGTRIRSLPLSLPQLGQLRALLLKDCDYLVDLTPLERLSRLEVLDLSETRINELPIGMKNLSNLRQLNLSGTHSLKTIQAGIISNLSNLEVLDMTNSGFKFSVQGAVEEDQTTFEELLCLQRLLVLFVDLVRFPCLSSNDLSWIERLRRFQLLIGFSWENFSVRSTHDKTVTIKFFDLSGEQIGGLLKNASSLVLNDCLGVKEMLEKLVIKSNHSFAGLKSLTIADYYSSLLPRGGCAARSDLLPNLEELHLERVSHIRSISELVGHLGLKFLRLKLIEVTGCAKMCSLLNCDSPIHSLPNLEEIRVRFCPELAQLFDHHSMQNVGRDPVVPNLRTLKLENLPKLITLCRDGETWPRLEQVDVIKCNLLRKLPLAEQNAETIKQIRSESPWWDSLEWDADKTKISLQPYFHPR